MSVTVWANPRIAYEGYLDGIRNRPWKNTEHHDFIPCMSYEDGRHVAAYIKTVETKPIESFESFQNYVGVYNVFCREMRDINETV